MSAEVLSDITLTSQKQTPEDAALQRQLQADGPLPQHVAIIMDGNGRWAKQRSMPRVRGHQRGVESVRDTTEACAQLGIGFLTLYAFSTENWQRPAREVNALMRLLVRTLLKETRTLDENGIRLATIGDMARLPQEARSLLDEAIAQTAGNQRMQLTLALSYSGRWELTRAVRQIAAQVARGELQPEAIETQTLAQALDTAQMPDPDLLIRTGGDHRISNFLLWQSAYTEFFFTPTFWPDFRRDHLYEALREFQNRDRRYGQVR